MTHYPLRSPPNYKSAVQTAPNNQAVLSYRWLDTRRALLPGKGPVSGASREGPSCPGVAARSPAGGLGRAPRWEAAAAEVISCAWPRAARRARCGHSGRGAEAGAGAGFVRSSPDLPGSDLGPPRPPRPLLPGSGDPAASRDWAGAAAGQRRAWRPGARRDSRQLTQVSGPGDRGGPGGPAVCSPQRAYGGADWPGSSRRRGRLRSRCLPT